MQEEKLAASNAQGEGASPASAILLGEIADRCGGRGDASSKKYSEIGADQKAN